MSVLICGSLAYDTVMVYPGCFSDHILPDQVHNLNVCFLVPAMNREFGGCAGNIAYNLNLLCDEVALPMATAGKDFAPYAKWLKRCNIDCRYIEVLDQHYTAQGFITTDAKANQITAFHAGAMEQAHINQVPLDAGIKLGIVAPDGHQAMIEHGRQFADAGIDFIFDPGQGLPMFSADELKVLIDQATWVVVNDYEAQLMQRCLGYSAKELANQLQAYIVTQGDQGSIIYAQGQRLDIPAIPVLQVKDPTGCGDAYRAGLLYGLLRGFDWPACGRLAALMGGIKIEQVGSQNHLVSREQIMSRYQQAYQQALDLH